MPKDIAM